jgi:hypothetical protein
MSGAGDSLTAVSSVEFVHHVERLRQVLATLSQSNSTQTPTTASKSMSDRTHLTINVPESSPTKSECWDPDELQAALVDAGFSPLPVRRTRRPAVVAAASNEVSQAIDAEQAALEAALEQTKRTIQQLSLEVVLFWYLLVFNCLSIFYLVLCFQELLTRENQTQDSQILSPSPTPTSSACEPFDSPRRNVPFYSVALSGFLSPLMETSRDNILDQSSDEAMSENMIAST